MISQIGRSQAYYNNFAKSIKQGAAFFNERTGKTLLVFPEGQNSLVSVIQGKMNSPVFKGELTDICNSFGNSEEIFRIFKDGTKAYRKQGSVVPFLTQANSCSFDKYI